MKSVLIGIYGDIYDVTEYIHQHPGEGIKNIYLRSYHRHNVSDEFERMHMTDEPFEIIIKAKETGHENGIYYVCPYFFTNPLKKRIPRIPKYFRFLKNDPYGLEYMKNKR